MTKASENVELLNWLEANQAALAGLVGGGAQVPIGAIIDYGSSSTPAEYLPCNGAPISRATYAALFAVIGVTWGVGDGSTTFNVPNLNGYVTAGSGSDWGGYMPNFTVGGFNGSASHLLALAEIPSHNHPGSSTDSAGTHSHSYDGAAVNGSSGNGGDNALASPGLTTGAAGAHTHAVSIASQGGGTAHNNIQPTAIMNKVIRAR